MITGELKSKVDRIWDTMWSGGISNPLSVIEQLTYLLFIKGLDELHTRKEHRAARTGHPIEEPVFTAGQDALRWSRFKELAPERMFETVRDRVFPFIKSLGQNGDSDEGSTYTHHMKDALFMMPTARVLANAVDQLDDIDMADRDTKGDLYEYMLGRIATAGQNGQFRTPRHIIRLMVDMTAPTPKDVICDPACGTAGFLVAASEHLVEYHGDRIYKNAQARRRFNQGTFHGYDFDTTMLRIGSMAEALTTELHREVAAMNCENFIVRMQLEAVERFRQREAWERLTASDVEILQSEVAGLPSEIETDDIESRLFDLTALKMQLAFAEGDTGTFEQHRRRVVEIAMLLEEKSTIPAVAAQLAYLASVQESAFWETIALNDLEELRLRLRGLVPFLDKKTRTIVYTDFQDEITAVREGAAVYLPKMTGVQYEKKVQEYLKNHLDHIVIHRLRTNQPLTATDLRGFEQTLVEIGEDDGQTLLTGLLARSDAPSLAHFVRSMVGMDRAAAQEAFSEFLSNRSLTTPQIRFIEMVIDQLTARGVMEPSALYEAPFSSVHAGGPEALFAGKSNVIEGIFEKLKALHPEPLADVG